MARIRRSAATTYDSITVEGGLISSAMLARIAAGKALNQSETDYEIPKGLAVRDEIARFFRIGAALFKDLFASSSPSAAATIGFTESLLRQVFGFGDIRAIGMHQHGDRHFPVTLEALNGRVPIVVVSPFHDLDHASTTLTSDGKRRSASSAIEDWLNYSETAHWGFCTNGERLRLVRDNASLTRPAYIEADLRQMFEGEAFADFAALWLLIHASRFGGPQAVGAAFGDPQGRTLGGRLVEGRGRPGN